MSRCVTEQDTALARLAQCNPVPPSGVNDAVGGDRPAELLLASIMATPRPAAQGSSTPVMGVGTTGSSGLASHRRASGVAVSVRIALTAAAVAALVLGLVGLPGGTSPAYAYAATPPMLALHPTGRSASALLHTLAGRAALAPASAGTGPYDYLQIQSWSLNSAVAGHQANSTIVPELTRLWSAPDGSGRLNSVPGTASLSHGALTVNQDGPGQDLRPGSDGVARTPRLDLTTLLTAPKVLANQLLVNSGGLSYDPDTVNDPVALQLLRNVLTLHQQQVLSPQVNAALLQVLAAIPGIRGQGNVTDRVGRPGVAVSLDATWGRPYRYVLVFDQTSGALLDHEQIATTIYRAGQPEPLHVHIPAVVQYMAYLTSRHTTTPGSPLHG